jgi:actin, other eukaryote
MNNTIIIDIGSNKTKIGLSGSKNPEKIFSSNIDSNKQVLEYGEIKNWDIFEKILNKAFNQELNITPNDRKILFAETPFNSKENREKLTETMFENFKISKFNSSFQPLLSILSYDRITGCVFESGDSLTYFSPIYNGKLLKSNILKSEIGGKDVTNFLIKLFK